jgi:DNA repair protein RadC
VQLQEIFELSRRALSEQIQVKDILSSPKQVSVYLYLKLGNLMREVFLVLFLDAQNRVVKTEKMFSGTLTQTSVYPREVFKRALRHNTASVIFAHNHPSGVTQQSHSDELITKQLKEALALFDVRVLDHFIVVGNTTLSFVEQDLL